MDSFHQWKTKAQERKFFRVLTGTAYEFRYIHLGRQVLAAFREAVHDAKKVQARSASFPMISLRCRAVWARTT